MNWEKRGRQAHEASVCLKGRTNVHHLSVHSDTLLWGLPISWQLSVFLPSYLYDARNTECCMPECFSVSISQTSWLTATIEERPFRNGMRRREPSGRVCRRLSGRCSLRFLLAHPKKGSPNDEAVSQKVTKREIDGKTWLLFQLSPVLTADGCHWGMSVKEWQQGSEQGFLLATPLPYYSLRLVPWVWYGIKDSTNERAVSRDTWWKWWGKPFLIEMTTEIHGIANQKETKW